MSYYIFTLVGTCICIYANITELIVTTLDRYENPRDLKIKKHCRPLSTDRLIIVINSV